jgi:hypothetical protein
MTQVVLPTALTPASWDKHKGVIAKVKPTGIGEALKVLSKLHSDIAFAAFAASAPKTVAEAESQLATVDVQAGKATKAAEQARAVQALAKKAEADFKANKLIPKSARDAAAAVAQAAADFARDLDAAASSAQSDAKKQLDVQRTAAAKAAKDKPADDEDDPSLEKLKKTVVDAMRMAKKAQNEPGAKPVNFMIAEKGKQLVPWITPRSVGESQKKVLRKLVGSEAGVKFYEGQVGFDAKSKAWSFEGDSVPTGGFGKKLQLGLKELTGTAYKLRVRKTGGEFEEVEGESQDAEEAGTGAPTTPTKAPSGAPGEGAAAKALLDRLNLAKPSLDKMIAAGVPNAAQLTKALDSAMAAILALQLDTAAKLVQTLEGLAAGGAKPLPTPPKAPDPAGAEREQLRAEVDSVVARIAPLLAQGISDESLRKPLADDFAKLQGSIEKAGAIADARSAVTGLRAVKLKADALLVQAQQAQAVDQLNTQTLQPALAKAHEAVDSLAAEGAKKVLQALLLALEAERDRCMKASNADALQSKVVVGVRKVTDIAAAIDAATKKADTELAAVAQALVGLGADAPAALAQTLRQLQARRAAAWPEGATGEAIAKAVTEFAEQVGQLAAAAAAAKKTADDRKLYESKYAAIQPDATKAGTLLTSAPDIFTDAQKKVWNDAERGRSEAVARSDWLAAIGSTDALKVATAAVLKAKVDHDAYRTEFAAARAAFEAVMLYCYSNSAGMPDPEAADLWAAKKSHEQAVKARDWVAAKTAVGPLKTATVAGSKVVTAGAAYYQAYNPHHTDIQQAWFAADKATTGPLAARALQYKQSLTALRELVGKRQWATAKTNLDAVVKAAQKMRADRAEYENAKVPFDAAFNAITTDLAKARAIAAAPPKKVKGAQLKTFREKFAIVNDARNAGEFAQAIAGIEPLKAAIADLLQVMERFYRERGEYETEVASVLRREEAASLAASAPAALADLAQKFRTADEAVRMRADAEDWVGAKTAVPALRDAAAKLLEAKAAFNTAAKPEDTAALRAQLATRKPRTDKAEEAPVPNFVDYLQRAVRDQLDRIELLFGEKDLAAVEAALTPLDKALDEMDAGKARYAAHKSKFDAALNGVVKTARGTPLAPAPLAKARDDGLAKSQKAIEALADADKLARADAKVVQWIAEADAWAKSKEAYDTLNTPKPNVAKLEALAKAPGGGPVMDALVLSLPPTASTDVMSAALQARFGFAVKRFEKPNKDEADLTGLTQITGNLPDKSLQRTYEVLTRVPDTHLKGKVTELIDYNANAGGAMFSNTERKIYMYCGRPEDDAETTLGKEEEIVPEGESVDPDCKPVDHAPIKNYDHSLLHEAGHAQDLASKTMVNANGKNDLSMGSWILHGNNVTAIAKAASDHFGVPQTYIQAMLTTAGSKPPSTKPPKPAALSEDDWKLKLKSAQDWCKLIRVDNELWNLPTLSKQLAIDNRVYHEAYGGRWVSYDIRARSKGISAYQFRSEWEWFAELYAAYFSGKLAKSHPATSWLKAMSPPA